MFLSFQKNTYFLSPDDATTLVGALCPGSGGGPLPVGGGAGAGGQEEQGQGEVIEKKLRTLFSLMQCFY